MTDAANGVADGAPAQAFVRFKGELPVLDEDSSLRLALHTRDGAGAALLPKAVVGVRLGDVPLCDEWMLRILHSVSSSDGREVARR